AALRAAGRAPAEPRGPVVVIVFDDAGMTHGLSCAAEIRAAGLAAEVYLGRAGLKTQMKYADRRGAPAAVILGGDEIDKGLATVKDLDAGRVLAAGLADNAAWKAERPGQVTVPRAALIPTLRRILDEASRNDAETR
ncbi:MAG: histidine--tRNA ligase, partial [Alphaproteobacteria bacterium]|nr:histidine--tRNA ligase [Alphaproteobacteria bacterium]